MLDSASISCPYCGESIELALDPLPGSQSFIEDCSVCCRPIAVETLFDDDLNLLAVNARGEDE